MNDFEGSQVKTRKYTQEDFVKRMLKPIIEVDFKVAIEPNDFMYEDTIPMYISMPRLAWKFLHGCAKSSGTTPGEVASEWLTDTAVSLFESIKSGNKDVNDLVDKFKEFREMREHMDSVKSYINKKENEKGEKDV